jgi:hypothetical protein
MNRLYAEDSVYLLHMTQTWILFCSFWSNQIFDFKPWLNLQPGSAGELLKQVYNHEIKSNIFAWRMVSDFVFLYLNQNSNILFSHNLETLALSYTFVKIELKNHLNMIFL